MTQPVLDRAAWQDLSSLLDEVLDLPPDARSSWLAALSTRDEALAATLARMLGAAAPRTSLVPDGFERQLGIALADDDAPLVGRRFGPWRLERKLGEGGMGQVWLAHRADGLYDGRAAIKLLRPELQRTALSARFDRERATLGRLNDPGIAHLLDAGIEDGTPYLVLEYVDGRSLDAHVAAACPTVASRVRLLIRIARAVEHAHSLLIVHRDLKPANVLVTDDGTPKLLDFGIAGLLDDEGHDALTRQVGRGLTIGYAAPEQIAGEPIGIAADVFSLGVMLFELLAGRLPFATEGVTRAAAEHAVLHGEPLRLSAAGEGRLGRPVDFARVRGDLEAIVAKALRRDPAARHRNVAAFVADLESWLAFRPVGARRDDWRYRSRLWLRRHAWSATLVATVVVSLAGGLVATTWQWRRAQVAAHESEQVTSYLTGLLASANPDAHGGRWPTVLELLDDSRRKLADRFGDAPDVEVRMLGTLATTYTALNRYDLAIPLAEQWCALAAARYGEDDPRTIDGRLKLAEIYIPTGPWDRVVEILEPERPRVARLFGPDAERMRDVLHGLLLGYIRTGRLERAKQALDEAGALTARHFGPDDFERVFHHLYEAIYLSAAGDTRAAQRAMAATERDQRSPPPGMLRFALVLRRSAIEWQIRLGEYDRIEERLAAIGRDADRLLGPGNALAANLHPLLAQFHADRGEYAAALAEREITATTGAAGMPSAMRTIASVQAVLARVLARAADRDTLRAEAHAAAAQVDADRIALGNLRADARIAIARSALLLSDLPLAAEALGDARAVLADAPERDAAQWSRVDQVDGELARARGDLPRSRALLNARIDRLERGRDRGTPTLWAARLDLAYTAALANDPDATTLLARARAERPPTMPAGHPLDRLDARLAAAAQARPTALVDATEPWAVRGKDPNVRPSGGMF